MDTLPERQKSDLLSLFISRMASIKSRPHSPLLIIRRK